MLIAIIARTLRMWSLTERIISFVDQVVTGHFSDEINSILAQGQWAEELVFQYLQLNIPGNQSFDVLSIAIPIAPNGGAIGLAFSSGSKFADRNVRESVPGGILNLDFPLPESVGGAQSLPQRWRFEFRQQLRRASYASHRHRSQELAVRWQRASRSSCCGSDIASRQLQK